MSNVPKNAKYWQDVVVKNIMYLSTAYDLNTVKAYYAGVLRYIEGGAKT